MGVDDIAKVLTATPRKIYEMILQAGQAGLHRNRIEERLYGHKANGGPQTDSIKVMICRSINPLLKPAGLCIRARSRVYRIEQLS